MDDVDQIEAERAPAVPEGKRRGRETATDMVLSLTVVMVLVVMIFVLAQPPASDQQEIRAVDPTSDIAGFAEAVPSVPVPEAAPTDWTPTSSQFVVEDDRLRVGYVTAGGRYAEYAATAGLREDVLKEFVGDGQQLDPVDVDGVVWEQRVDQDGSLSLLREVGPVTVVVGTLRSSADLDELRLLAGSLR